MYSWCRLRVIRGIVKHDFYASAQRNVAVFGTILRLDFLSRLSRNIVDLISWKMLDRFPPDYVNDALWDRDKRFTFWGQKIKDWGRAGIKCVGNILLGIINIISWKVLDGFSPILNQRCITGQTREILGSKVKVQVEYPMPEIAPYGWTGDVYSIQHFTVEQWCRNKINSAGARRALSPKSLATGRVRGERALRPSPQARPHQLGSLGELCIVFPSVVCSEALAAKSFGAFWVLRVRSQQINVADYCGDENILSPRGIGIARASTPVASQFRRLCCQGQSY